LSQVGGEAYGDLMARNTNDPKFSTRLVQLRDRMESLLTEKAFTEETVSNPVHAFIHFWGLVFRSFLRNRCPVRATALAYTTLLALVPLLAVGLGVSSTLLRADEDQREQLIQQLVNQVAPQLGQMPGTDEERRETRERIIEDITSFIDNIHSGALGISGTLALLAVAIGLLSTIEITFNDIWGATRGRTLFSRVVCYWTAITLGPLIVLLATGLVISGQLLPAKEEPAEPKPALYNPGERSVPVIEEEVAPATDAVQLPRWVERLRDGLVGRLLFGVLPFLILTGSFALLYQLMPNTHVKWWAALLGGLVGGTLWILNSQFNVAFAARVVAASRIYGPLGVLPVFLIGLYVSWLIVLFGAQVAYAFQNRRAYLQEKLAEGTSQSGREIIALRLMLIIARRFRNGETPPSAVDLAAELGVPIRIVHRVIQPMHETNLLVEVNAPGPAYSPARPLSQISAEEILRALRSGIGQQPSMRPGADQELVAQVYGTVCEAERNAAVRLTLERLVEVPAGKEPGR
jgi:membrane protein